MDIKSLVEVSVSDKRKNYSFNCPVKVMDAFDKVVEEINKLRPEDDQMNRNGLICMVLEDFVWNMKEQLEDIE
jgi:hypothetical protein